MGDGKIITFSSLGDLEINVEEDWDYLPLLYQKDWWKTFVNTTKTFKCNELYKQVKKEYEISITNKRCPQGISFLQEIRFSRGISRRVAISISQLSDNPIQNLFMAAHEECHAIDALRRVYKLKEAMEESGYHLKKELVELGEEGLANVGGLWRLFCVGYDVGQVRENFPYIPKINDILSLFSL